MAHDPLHNLPPPARFEPASPLHDTRLSYLDGQRDEREFSKAHRHSARIGYLKFVLLFVASIMVFGSIFYAWIFTATPHNISIGSASVRDGKLVMQDPAMSGFDRNQRPFQLNARQAVQQIDRPSVVELVAIDANLPMRKSSSANVKAANGVYDSEQELLYLRDDILVTTAEGMIIKLLEADINLKNGTMQSQAPVEINTEDTRLTAETMRVEDNGAVIVFQDNVRMRIVPTRKSSGASDR